MIIIKNGVNKIKEGECMLKKITITTTILAVFSILLFSFQSPPKTKTIIKDGDFVMDITNKNELVGNSENVFIGKVIRKVGTTTTKYYAPETQFEVEVLKNIKGELEGNEIINQEIGYYVDEKGDKYLTKYDKQEFLKEGEMYLFATIYSPKNDWHNPVPYYGELPIKNLNIDNVSNEYKTAFKNQVISEIHKKHKNSEFEKGRVKHKS